MDTKTLMLILILITFKPLQAQCEESNIGLRFLKQLRSFKREVRDDLSYIETDISALYDTVDDLKKSGTIAMYDQRDGKTSEQSQKCPVGCRAVIDGISQVNIAILKALESEKGINRHLQSQLKAMELEMQINRQLHSKLQALESENQNKMRNFEEALSDIAVENQNKLKNFEDAISNIAAENQNKLNTFEDAISDIAEETQYKFKSFEDATSNIAVENQNKLKTFEGAISNISVETQNKLKTFEGAISSIAAETQNKLNTFEGEISDITVDVDTFMSYVNDTLQRYERVRPTNNPVYPDVTPSKNFSDSKDKTKTTTTTTSTTTTNVPVYKDKDYTDYSEKATVTVMPTDNTKPGLEYDYDYEDYYDTTSSGPVTTRKPPITSYCTKAEKSGVYDIYLESINTKRAVYCDTDTDGGDWIVIMRRQDGSVDFNRKWDEYKNGFGDVNGEFWIGNDLIHAITKSKPVELRIDMEDFQGYKTNAKYSHFKIGSEAENYVLHVGGYSGTAGDSLVNVSEYRLVHDGMAFSTRDKDNDRRRNNRNDNCAEHYQGGWWFNDCFTSILTGRYWFDFGTMRRGIYWNSWEFLGEREGKPLQYVDMKIR